MSKFDTHGGYFAPKDYLRVNEGGSHEENPNGGVQIGVDPEGNPNLLEEGEPVYKDYVYSDNIEAEEQFLVDNNLPKKYAGKLYSKIADDLFSEAEERPLDPISRNGLEALLGRLADAQEGQKQAKEQRDLEEELAQLSPEELDQLEQMLAQASGTDQDGGAAGLPVSEVVPEEQMTGPAEPMPVEGMPMMANGGFLRTFEAGGPKKSMSDEIASEIVRQYDMQQRSLDGASGIGNTDLPLVTEHPDLDVALAAIQPGSLLMKALAPSAYRGIINGIANGEPSYMAFAPLAKLKNTKAALSATEIANINGKIADYGKDIALAQKELESLKKELDVVKKGGPGSRDVIKSGIEKANERIRFAKREQGRLRGQLPSTEKVADTTASEAVESANDANERTLVGHAVRTAFNPFYAGKQIWNKTAGSGWRWPATVIGGTLGAVPATGVWTGIGKGAETLIDAYKTPVGVDSGMLTPYTGYYSDEGLEEYNFDDELTGPLKACGGKINRYPSGGWLDFMNRLAAYEYSKNPANVAGKYAIDKRYDVWGGRNARQIEADKAYQDFTNYVLANSDNPDVRNYLRALDRGVAKGTPLLFNGDELVSNWDTLFGERRRDGKLGIYHINPEDIGSLTAPAAPTVPAQNPQNPAVQYELFPGQLAALQYGMQADNLSPRMRYAMSYSGENSPSDPDKPKADDTIYGGQIDPSIISPKKESGFSLLPTWPRYAGAIGSGLLGLYNAFQQPDRYTAPHINPQLPEGRINLQNQVYNPIDQNMIANAQIAQGNATNRALRNSGLGPSAGTAILAADNNLTGNLGTGFIQAWDANNQRRNAVIAANNQAEAQRAQFDYTVDAARKEAINRFIPYNAQNDLMVQRLNNQAEAEKYQAISNQISNGLQALSGIGQENFAMNQVNTNPSFLGYRVAPNGTMRYMPWYSCNGGFLKKFKK